MATARNAAKAKATAAPPPEGEVIVGYGAWGKDFQGLAWNSSELVGRQGYQVFDRMRRDDQCKAALAFKADTILASGWTVQSPADMDEDWDVTAFVERRLEALSPSLQRTLHLVLWAMVYGFIIGEKVFEEIEHGPDAGRVGIRAIKIKRPHEFEFVVDAFNNITGVRNGITGETHDPRKLLIYAYGAAVDNVYGESDLEAAYTTWRLLSATWKYLAVFLERQGVPPIFALYNPESLGPEQRQELKLILQNLQAASAAAIPRGAKDHFELWSPEHGGQVDQLFTPAIELMQRCIARALLMPGYMGLSPDSLGSYARARVSFDMFILHCQYVQTELAEQVVRDQIIRPLVDFNFNTGGVYPNFKFNPLTDEQIDKLAQAWRELVSSGAVVARGQDEDHIRQAMGFPKRHVPEGQSAEDEFEPRIPVASLDKLAPALKKNEVRRFMGLPPEPAWGEEPMASSPAKPAKLEEPDDEAKPGDEDPDDGPQGGGKGGNEGDQEEGDEPLSAEDMRALARERMLRAFKAPEGLPEPDEIKPEDFQVEEQPGEGPTWKETELTPPEKRADLAGIVGRLDGADSGAVQAIAATLRRDVRRQLDAMVQKPPKLTRGGKVLVPVATSVRTAILSAQRKVFGMGRADTRKEVGKSEAEFDAQVSYDPKAALAYLEAKADFFVTGMSETLTEIVRGEILSGLREGRPFTATASRLLDALAPWIGAPDADPKALAPDRLLTVVRTVSTDAYNQGRLVEARRLGGLGLVKGMTYSAVLDARTTPICRHLHGKSWRIDDPELTRYTPPNHYRCRSILLPATIADDIPAYITPEESAEAARLAEGKFGGSYRDTKANKP